MIQRKQVFGTERILYWTGFGISLIFLLVALYQQYFNGLEPCPLCILQRYCLGILGLFFFISALQSPKKFFRYVYAVFIIFFAILGAIIAGRQIWLESHPPSGTEFCIPGFSYIFSLFPSQQAWHLLLHGSASCSVINWTFFGLSIAVWTFLTFILLACLALTLMIQRA